MIRVEPAGAFAPDDALERRPRRDDVAEPADDVQQRELGMLDPEHGRGPLEKWRERQLRRLLHARRVVEELAEQQLDSTGLRRRPLDERLDERIRRRRAIERRDELVTDLVEQRRVELLLAREVIDDRRERQLGARRDVSHARTVKPVRDDDGFCGLEDPRACALALRRVTAVRQNGTFVP